MSSRSPTTRTRSRATTTSPDAMDTTPRLTPILLRVGAWVLYLVCLCLSFWRDPLRHWSGTIPAGRPIPLPTSLVDQIVIGLSRVLHAPIIELIWTVVAVGSLLLLWDAVRAVVCVVRATHQWDVRLWQHPRQPAPRTYVRIRNLHTSSTNPNDTGARLFQSLHEVLPVAQSHMWLSYILGATANSPVQLGVAIHGGTVQQRTALVGEIRKAVRGVDNQAVVDEQADPLTQASAGAPALVTREWTLPHPEYALPEPPDMRERIDTIGPLASAILHGPAVAYVEWSMTLVPQRDTHTHHDPFRMTMRGVAVPIAATPTARSAARNELQAIEHALRSYTVQRLARLYRVRRVISLAPLGLVVLSLLLGGIGWHAAPDLTTNYGMVSDPDLLFRLIILAVGLVPLVLWRYGHRAHWRRWLQRAPRPLPPRGILACWPWWQRPSLVTPADLRLFYHLPTGAIERTLVLRLKHPWIPAPEFAFVRPSDTDRVALGQGWMFEGAVAPVGLTKRDLRQILMLSSGMGGGKTRILLNVIQQLVHDGLVVFDGKEEAGNLIAHILPFIPREREADVIYFDVLDTAWPIGINPLMGIVLDEPGGKDMAVNQLKTIFARFDPRWEQAVGVQDFAENAMQLVIEGDPHPTLAGVFQAIVDDAYRSTLLERCHNPEVRFFWIETFPDLSTGQKESCAAFLRRLRKFLTSELTRFLVAQERPVFDFLEALEQRKIVLIPFPTVTLGDFASAVGMLQWQAFMRAAMRRPGDDQSRETVVFIADECDVIDLDDPAVKIILTKLRSLGVGTILSFQLTKQLGGVKEELMVNAGSQILLATPYLDANEYAKRHQGFGVTSEHIANQDPDEHQYASLTITTGKHQREKTGVFSMTPLPWPQVPASPPLVPEPADWQTSLPPNSPYPQLDRTIGQLVYQTPFAKWPQVVDHLAQATDAYWQRVNERWEVIRQYHVRYIQDHPGCIPEQKQRIVWLSRLQHARRHNIFHQVDYQRTRRPVDPTAVPVSSAQANGSARTTKGGTTAMEQEPPPPTNFSEADRPSTEADVWMPFNDEHLLED